MVNPFPLIPVSKEVPAQESDRIRKGPSKLVFEWKGLDQQHGNSFSKKYFSLFFGIVSMASRSHLSVEDNKEGNYGEDIGEIEEIA